MSATTVTGSLSPDLAAIRRDAYSSVNGFQAEDPPGFGSGIDFNELDYGPQVERHRGHYIQIPGRWFQDATPLIVLPKTGSAILIRVAKQHPNDKATRRTALNDVKGPVLITIYAQDVLSNEITLKQDLWVTINRTIGIDEIFGQIRARTKQQGIETIQDDNGAISRIANVVSILYPPADKSQLLQSIDRIVDVPMPELKK